MSKETKINEEKITCAKTQGSRSHQQDRDIIYPSPDGNKHLLAIMDGHSGSEAAEFCQKNIPRLWLFSQIKDGGEAALKRLIERLNEETREMSSGSTISVVYVSEGQNMAWVAVLGDSPVIIVDKNGHINISPDHNARSNIQEREWAIDRGGKYEDGYIWYGGRGLQLTRALGDVHLTKILNRRPEIYFVELGPDSVIVVASDGLIDPFHQKSREESKLVAELAKKGSGAQELINWRIKEGIHDNATAIVWRGQGK